VDLLRKDDTWLKRIVRLCDDQPSHEWRSAPWRFVDEQTAKVYSEIGLRAIATVSSTLLVVELSAAPREIPSAFARALGVSVDLPILD
jgi:hypothetical protein